MVVGVEKMGSGWVLSRSTRFADKLTEFGINDELEQCDIDVAGRLADWYNVSLNNW